MSLREELERALVAQWEPDAGDDEANWLIRDHGYALLGAVRDQERYREARAMILEESSMVNGRAVETNGEFDREIDKAIDTARNKTVDGGGV